MPDKTAFGERMKAYEGAEAARRFLPGLPVIARIDGKRFSRWTHGLPRPYDPRLSEVMIEVTGWLVEQTGARVGYTQSDEITLVLHVDNIGQQVFLDGRIQKLVSILASMATSRFNDLARVAIPERADQPAMFDCRCWTVPSLEEAANTVLWRERDATKNSLQMAARHHHPHSALDGKAGPEMHELLRQVGVNWNDYPAFFKRGSFLRRETVRTPFTAEELAALPEKHAARRDPGLVIERSRVQRLEMPPFDKVVNRVGVVFDGEAPQTASP